MAWRLHLEKASHPEGNGGFTLQGVKGHLPVPYRNFMRNYVIIHIT
jgi:hypothetical protein